MEARACTGGCSKGLIPTSKDCSLSWHMVERRPLPSTWVPGSLIPGTVYRIIRLIGQGGMGEVYEVEHDMLGTRRALKGLVKGFAGRTDLAERLRVEARGLARLRHPNLVEVYDLGTALDGRIYFVMELLEGATLRAMLSDQGRLSVSISVELMIQVLAGLQAAHGAGIVHRDVKPENVFVCRDGTVKLLDFGVAKVMDAWIPNQPITVKGMTVGTPQYMSPEQAEGRALDGRTDVYAAALVLWEMLIGRPAYSDTDVYELLQAKWRGVMPLAEMGIGVSRGLSDVIVRASQPDLNERYPSATAFQQALRIALVQSYLSSEAAEPKLRKKRDSLPSLEDMARSNRLMPPDVDATALTELVEAALAVDRDAPTRSHARALGPRGPTGTEILPAISPRPEARPMTESMQADQSVAVEDKACRSRVSGNTLSLSHLPWVSWIAGTIAFLIPVMLAVLVGFWHFRKPSHAPEASSSMGAQGISRASAEPTDSLADAAAVPSWEENATIEGGVDVDSDAVVREDSSVSSATAGVKKPPIPKTSARVEATMALPPSPAVSSPPVSSERKMPKSGL